MTPSQGGRNDGNGKTLTITNDGPRIVTTNYWDTEHACGGKYYCSVNAGAIRILVPPQRAADIEEWNACRYVIVSRGPWPQMALPDAVSCSSKTSATPHTACILSRGRSICCPEIRAIRNGSSPPGWRGQPWLSSGPRSGDASSVSRGSRLGSDSPNLPSHAGGRPWFSDGEQRKQKGRVSGPFNSEFASIRVLSDDTAKNSPRAGRGSRKRDAVATEQKRQFGPSLRSGHRSKGWR